METSLISAFFAADMGKLQLAAAAFLAKNDPQSGPSVAQLLDAAQQDFTPLAAFPAAVGANLDISV
jgi:hypothetical protein